MEELSFTVFLFLNFARMDVFINWLSMYCSELNHECISIWCKSPICAGVFHATFFIVNFNETEGAKLDDARIDFAGGMGEVGKVFIFELLGFLVDFRCLLREEGFQRAFK